MRIDQEIKLDFKDVLICPKRSTLKTRSEVSLEREYTFKNSGVTWKGVPVIASNMDTVGTFKTASVMQKNQMLTAAHKFYDLEEWELFLNAADKTIYNSIMISSGVRQNDFEMLENVLEKFPSLIFICLDVANGYFEGFVDFVAKTRQRFPGKVLVAGNVVTGEMAEQMILSGADIVKVGIGPGSVCTTRVKTGVGYPQFSAIVECADAAHGLGGHIIADGGCAVPGDIAKAFGAGADFVMLGGMLAGHAESDGHLFSKDGKKFMEFYGMSSETSMNKYNGGVAKYRTAEGKRVVIPYRGHLQNSVDDIKGGLRSTCTYVGARHLKELTKRTTFIRVTQQHNQIFDNYQ